MKERKRDRENCNPMRLLYNVNGGMIKIFFPFVFHRKETVE